MPPLDESGYALNPRAFMEDILPVVDRDSAGEIIDWKFRHGQAELYDTIQTIRAFNIYRSAFRQRQNGTLGALANILDLPGDLPDTAEECVRLILSEGVDHVLKSMRLHGFKKVTDSPVRLLVGKARQIGVSTEIAGWGTHFSKFHPNSKACVISHEGESAQNILDIISTFHQHWNEEKLPKPTLLGESKTNLRFENGSTFMVKSAGSLGVRGFKFDWIHLSEFAHYEKVSAIYAALMGVPAHAWVIIESTANGKGGPFFEEWKKAWNIWDLIKAWDNKLQIPERAFCKFFSSWLDDPNYTLPVDPWEEQPILDSLDAYEQSLFQRYPDKVDTGRIKWLRSKIEEARDDVLDPVQITRQEYPVDEDEMFQTAGAVQFDVTKQIPRAEAASKIAALFRVDSGLFLEYLPPARSAVANLIVFESPKKYHSYVIGVDVAKGLRHKDASVISVFDRGDDTRLRQVAEFRGWIDQQTLGELAVLLGEIYNNAWIVQEINDATLVAATIVDLCGYTNYYIRQQHDKLGGDQVEFRYGFHTSSTTKRLIIEALKVAMRDDTIYIHSLQGCRELSAYTRDEKGGYGAPEGQHDDCVISYALAWFGHLPMANPPPLTERPYTRKLIVGEDGREVPQKPDVQAEAIEENYDKLLHPVEARWYRMLLEEDREIMRGESDLDADEASVGLDTPMELVLVD